MRREFIQVVAIFAIAFGGGMFAFGRRLDPPLNSTHPAAIERAISTDKDTRIFASVATGFGVCLMTFGALSLVIPWVNDVLARRRERTDTHMV
jgi:hypothetical protein